MHCGTWNMCRSFGLLPVSMCRSAVDITQVVCMMMNRMAEPADFPALEITKCITPRRQLFEPFTILLRLVLNEVKARQKGAC